MLLIAPPRSSSLQGTTNTPSQTSGFTAWIRARASFTNAAIRSDFHSRNRARCALRMISARFLGPSAAVPTWMPVSSSKRRRHTGQKQDCRRRGSATSQCPG